jgi:hypothetical protein
MPTALRELLRFEYPIAIDLGSRLHGKNQMLAARMNPGEG